MCVNMSPYINKDFFFFEGVFQEYILMQILVCLFLATAVMTVLAIQLLFLTIELKYKEAYS